MKILIGTPVYNLQVTAPFMASVLELTRHFQANGIEYEWLWPSGTLINAARNRLASAVLCGDHSHLLFIDADVSFQVSTVLRLLDFARPVAAAVYPHRRFNLQDLHKAAQTTDSPTEAFARSLTYPVKFSTPATIDRGFVLSEYAPTGLMLITRAALEELRGAYPDLYVDVGPDHEPPHVLQCFEPMLDERRMSVGEDVALCTRWRAIGGEIWSLVEDAVGHTGPHTFRGAVASRMGAARRGA